MKRATIFLASLPRFHVKASVVYDMPQEEVRLLQFEKVGDLYLQGPDRFFAVFASMTAAEGNAGKSFRRASWSNGTDYPSVCG